jgi:hypothetical protein
MVRPAIHSFSGKPETRSRVDISESMSFGHSAIVNHRPEDKKLMVANSTILGLRLATDDPNSISS